MLFKRLVREQAETIFIVIQNNIGGGTAMLKDMAVQLDLTTAGDGNKTVAATAAGLWGFLGIADANIADQDYGLCQVFGFRSTAMVLCTNTSQAAGLPLVMNSSGSYLASVATTFASNTTASLQPIYAILAASISTSNASVLAAVFLRAL